MADDALHYNVSWSQDAFAAAVKTKVELPWSNDTTSFPDKPKHDLLKVIGRLHQQYVPTDIQKTLDHL